MDDTEKSCSNNSGDYEARPYQVELLEAALESNTIVLLGTGAGKTFIAVMLIKLLSAVTLGRFGDTGVKRSVFLVNTVPLVSQQSSYIEKHTPLRVGKFWGEMGVDNWTAAMWDQEFDRYNVLVMTRQIFLGALSHNFIQISEVNLIVFDECHHAVKNDPYVKIMQDFYHRCPEHDRPHILGLSASIVSGKCRPGDLKKKLKQLEITLGCRIETAQDLAEVSKYATNPDEVLLTFGQHSVNSSVPHLRKELSNLLEFLETCVSTKKNRKEVRKDKEIRNLVEDCLSVLDDIGISSAIKAAETVQEDLHALTEEELSEWEKGLVFSALTNLTIFSQCCHRALKVEKENDFSPKFSKLIEVLHNESTRLDTKLCGIVFVERRTTAVCLSSAINKLNEHIFPEGALVRADFIVGHGAIQKVQEQYGTKMNTSRQQQVLRRFRNDTINLLVATSVVEEGLDVRKCNLVVRYDFPKTFQSYVQSKGRARSKGSKYLVLVNEEEVLNCKGKLREYRMIEEELQSICHGRTVPLADEIEKRLMGLYPPFMPMGEIGPKITIDGSLSLLYKYCQKLPHDQYTLSTPAFNKDILTEGGFCFLDYKVYQPMFVVTINLPMTSPIRDSIQGPALPSLRLAQKAAALLAIEKLYREKELDDHLKPISHKELDSDEEDQEKMEKKKRHNAGTTKRSLYYENEIALCLHQCHPTVGNVNNLYVFIMEYKDCKQQYYRCQKESNVIQTVGLLTSQVLPYHKMPQFSLYISKQELLVTVSKYQVYVTPCDIQMYRQFHSTLFAKVLKITHLQASFDTGRHDYLVVPATVVIDSDNGDECIGFVDTDTLQYIIENGDNHPQKFSQENPNRMKLVSKNYTEDKVKDQIRLYEVLRVDKNTTPLSQFPDKPTLTYVEYFKMKYNSSISNLEQNALICKPVSTNVRSLQLLNSRYKDDPPAADARLAEIVLFPELCNLHPIPANLLYIFRCVPSLLYRIEAFLLLEEFSTSVTRETNIGLSKCGQSLVTTATAVNINDHNPCAKYCLTMRINSDLKPTKCNMYNEFEGVIYSPDIGLLLQAFTPLSANDCINSERLEVLGDSFLKMTTSVNLFCSRGNHHEGRLTMARTNRVSNFNLWYLAQKMGIPGKILSKKLNPFESWLPPCFVPRDCDEACFSNYSTHKLSDKGIADCVEALIGSYIIAGGLESGFKLLQYLGLKFDYPQPEDLLPLKCKDVNMHSASQESLMSIGQDMITAPILIQNSTQIFPMYCQTPPSVIINKNITDPNHALDKLLYNYETLCDKLNWHFKNKGLLLEALTHPSYIKNNLTGCYQRLEFLGDAILDYLITCHIYSRFPHYTPGKITEMRSALVNNMTFAEIAVRELQLHKHLLHESPALFHQISEYVDWLDMVWKEDKEEKSILLCRSVSYQDTCTNKANTDSGSAVNNLANNDRIQLQDLVSGSMHSMPLEGVVNENAEVPMVVEDIPRDTVTEVEVEEIEPPKALGDLLESIAGALFLDSDMSLDIVWLNFYPFFQPLIEKYSNEGLPIPPIKELHELGHTIEINVESSLESTQGADRRYRCTIKVIDKMIQVTAIGKTKILARRAAARRAIKLLKMTHE